MNEIEDNLLALKDQAWKVYAGIKIVSDAIHAANLVTPVEPSLQECVARAMRLANRARGQDRDYYEMADAAIRTINKMNQASRK